MTELGHTVANPDVYESLLDRLGLALDKAKTALRLLDERPVELELKGLTPAELEVIEGYLGCSVGEASQTGLIRADVRPGPSAPPGVPPFRSDKVIWLNDIRRVGQTARLRRYNSPRKH